MAKPLTKFYARDREVLTGIGKTGFFEKEDILKFYTESRLDSVLNGNQFIKETHCQDEGKTIYTITPEGRDFIKDKWGVTAYTFKSYEHDNVLREEYLSFSREERYRTMSEPDFRNYVTEEITRMRYSDDEEERRRGSEMDMKLSNGTYSLPDMATIRDEDYKGDDHRPALCEFTLTESVTRNYTEEQIEHKCNFANDSGATMNLIRTY